MQKRIQRLNQLIKKEVAQLILREVEFPKDVLVTVTRAEVTPDLRESKVYVSIMPEKEESQILDFLNRRIFLLQRSALASWLPGQIYSILFLFFFQLF